MQLTTSCAVICLIHALTCMSGHASIARGKSYPGFLTQRQRYDQPERFAREGDSEESTSSEETDSSEGSARVLRCPAGWYQYGTSCYYESSDYKTWDDARMSCQALGSDLVEINSQAELEFISTLPIPGTSLFWTGLTDSDTEGDFVWISSGSSLSFSNWGTNQPFGTNPLYDCVIIRGLEGWRTRKCDIKYDYLCERAADMNDSR